MEWLQASTFITGYALEIWFADNQNRWILVNNESTEIHNSTTTRRIKPSDSQLYECWMIIVIDEWF